MPTLPDWARPGDPAPANRTHLTAAWLTAVAVLAACVGGLGTAYGFSRISTGTDVLVVSRTVLQGSVIAAADLGLAEVTAPGVPTVDAGQRDAVVGQRARSTLPQGSLLAPGSFGQPSVGPGMSQVQLRLAPTQVPSAPLPGGQQLLLLCLGDDATGVTIGAYVAYPPVAQGDGSVVLDVLVDSDDVEQLAPYAVHQHVVVAITAQ